MMSDILLLILIVGIMTLALGVDLGVLINWFKQRMR
jgi:hypothetical protein